MWEYLYQNCTHSVTHFSKCKDGIMRIFKQCCFALFLWTVSQSAYLTLSEKAMAPHSSTLAWKIPWAEEPEGLQSMGSLRVGHDCVTSLSFFTFMHWRRKWQPTPVFLPGESQGRGEPGGLPSMGSHRVEHDWSDLAAVAPTPSTLYDMSQRRQKVTFLECFFCMFSAFKDLNSIYCMFNPE